MAKGSQPKPSKRARKRSNSKDKLENGHHKARRARGRPKTAHPERSAKKEPSTFLTDEDDGEREYEDSSLSGLDDSPIEVVEAEHEVIPVNHDLIREIKREYRIVRKMYNKRVASDGYSYFDPSFSITPKTKCLLQIPKTPRYTFSRGVKPASFKNSSSKTYYLPKGSLTYQMPLPTMRYWSHTNVNIVGKDQWSLSHVPYLGDGEDDPQFTDELMNAYEEGIHGEKIGWGKMINDFILYHMVAPIIERHGFTEHLQLCLLMKAVYELFPNKNSAKEMAADYADLVSRFAPHKSVRDRLFDDMGELKQNFSPAILQSSNRNLLCKRCYLIDCIVHPEEVTGSDVHIQRAEKTLDEPKDPCGIYCYRHHLPKSPSKKSPRKRTSVCLDVAVPDNNAHWTPHEESMINLLKRCHVTANCRLAQLLSTMCRSPPKTCKQVYDYIKAGITYSPVVDTGERGEIERDPIKRTLVPLNHRIFRYNSDRQLDNRTPYSSCNHIGECSIENDCNCRKEKRMCNKFCGCPTDCRHRFPGCRCKPGNCRTNQCQCYFAKWECDADMCKSCNCDGTDEKSDLVCKNINIQRCLQRKLYIAPSEIAGTGCFAEEFIPKNEYIGEYCGEIVSQQEAERRGKIYDKFKCSYLFTMNCDQAVDATRVGNIMRFINHSKTPNCAGRVMIVNGDHRLAFFALSDIQPNEELFFDYSYNSNQLKEFVYIEKHKSKKAQQATNHTSKLSV